MLYLCAFFLGGRRVDSFLPFLRDTEKASGSRSEKRYSQRELCCGGLPQGNFQGNRPWNVLDMEERAKQKY